MKEKLLWAIFVLLIFIGKGSNAQYDSNDLHDKLIVVLDIQGHFTINVLTESSSSQLINNINKVY